MKRIFLLLTIAVLTFATIPEGIFAADNDSTTTAGSVINAANESVKVLTNNPQAEITHPDTFDPGNVASLMEWWVWLTGVLSPFILLLINRFWPSSTKKELVLKSTIAGLIIIWAVILLAGGGLNIMSVAMALVMFIIKVFTYEKLYQPLGLSSYKLYKTGSEN